MIFSGTPVKTKPLFHVSTVFNCPIHQQKMILFCLDAPNHYCAAAMKSIQGVFNRVVNLESRIPSHDRILERPINTFLNDLKIKKTNAAKYITDTKRRHRSLRDNLILKREASLRYISRCVCTIMDS